jgi:hypothetical protein
LLDSAAYDSHTDCLEAKSDAWSTAGVEHLPRRLVVDNVEMAKKVKIPRDPWELVQRANHYRT